LKVMVCGMDHLGSVTAGCLASLGHEVVGIDVGIFPDEPGLEDLMSPVVIGDVGDAAGADVVWVTYDTPVNLEDVAAVESVLKKIRKIMPNVVEGTPVIVSSQLPVGTINRLESEFPRHVFVCVPENLRHGTAVRNFLHADRIVVGCRPSTNRARLLDLLIPVCPRVLFMPTESAEMVKHAINAWMAMSICFINEIADLCRLSGADPMEVERGMRSEERIGQKAYIRPGGPFTGRTLARDLQYLRELVGANDAEFPLIWSIKESNERRTD
jgi:UDPglucose 6-dehydrogenase